MIKYTLVCRSQHEFEAWFSNSEAFERQSELDQVACPACGSPRVAKALMAPNVASRKASVGDFLSERRSEVLDQLSKLREQVLANAEYVGPRFADEARKIHYEDDSSRDIYGEATGEEVRALAEEGIDVLPLPRLPKDNN